MRKYNLGKSLTAFVLAWTLLAVPFAATAQTRVRMPSNKYKVQDDVKVGREAAQQVEREFPILSDAEATRYVENVGQRLVDAIPQEFQQPSFDYRFKIVNARDINAFALPGGPMYVNRGMIEAARTEGEMAGVMAHEISHVALRHGTAQATTRSNPINQILGIGAILGGAILGGQTGAQLGQMVVAGYFLRYNREYETQADILGSQIMANAGYDPRDLANMFRTIEKEGGGGSNGPDWLSSHPNPKDRYETINREADLLRVNNPVQNTAMFERIQSKLRRMPRALSMKEIEQNAKNNRQEQSPTANGRYENSVAYPSVRTRVFTSGNWIQLSIPSNWQDFPSETEVWFAPRGAYGNQGITHGALIGIYRSQNENLSQASQEYVNSVLESNNYLRRQTNYSRSSISGRQAYAVVLSGRSPVTNRNETVTVYTTLLRSGDVFYVVTVSPTDEVSRYNASFRNMVRSIRLNE